jgi:hypothetical protein
MRPGRLRRRDVQGVQEQEDHKDVEGKAQAEGEAATPLYQGELRS